MKKNATNIAWGHCSRTYHTSKYLVELYQASLKKKKMSTNFIDQNDDDADEMTHFDVTDFFEHPEDAK